MNKTTALVIWIFILLFCASIDSNMEPVGQSAPSSNYFPRTLTTLV